MGKISLEGMEFYAHHGYYRDEITRGNKFIVDLHFHTDFDEASKTDNLDKTLNYEEVYEIIKTQMSIRSNLLEHAANRMLNELKKHFPRISSIELKLSKLNPQLKGIVQKVSVSVTG